MLITKKTFYIKPKTIIYLLDRVLDCQDDI